METALDLWLSFVVLSWATFGILPLSVYLICELFDFMDNND